MAIRNYVGARYVPKFADPVEWQANTSYEAMVIVTYNNSSYTSKVPVPPTVGNPAENSAYWALTGNYNAQVEQYRQETKTVSNNLTTEITNRKNADTALQGQITEEVTNRKNADTALQGQITAEVTNRKTADATLQNNINAEATARQTADNTLQGNINSEAATRASADSNLQSQINQIVAPSGEAPSAAEVQNARIGADGVTYDTLGTAIRTQINNLNNDLDKIEEIGFDNLSIQYLDNSKWKENGTYYMAVNDLRSGGDSNYNAHEPITLGKGTYYYSGFDTLGSYGLIDNKSTKFSNPTGTFNVENSAVLYITCSHDKNKVIITNNEDLPTSNDVLGIYAYTFKGSNITDESIDNSKIKHKTIGANKVNFLNNSTQFLDIEKWDSNKYWYGVDDKQKPSASGYSAYAPLSLKAGTYYVKNVGLAGFCWKKTNGVSSALTFVNSSFTLDDDSVVYLTADPSSQDKSQCMLTDYPLFPNNADIKEYNYSLIGAFNLPNTLVVDSKGLGDFTNIQDALDSITNDSPTNRYTIVVMSGTYPKFDTKRKTDGSDHSFRYIDFIGVNRDTCIVKDTTGDYANPPANMKINGVVKNLSFIATNENLIETPRKYSYAYAIHMDFGGIQARFENCKFTSTNGPAIGMGMYSNNKCSFDNCYFEHNKTGSNGTSLLGALYAHFSGTNSVIEVHNCIVVNKTGNVAIKLDQLDNIVDSTALLTNNISYGSKGIEQSVSINGEHWNMGYSGNNNFTI